MNYNEDIEYMSLVDDILNHKEFEKTKDINHHGLNRYDHSIRVSYSSYKISKFLRLDYEEVARGGLLHDFFLTNGKKISRGERLSTLVRHPKYAVVYSEKFFRLTEKERDIIRTHMFPISLTLIPKFAESWIVNIMDNIVGCYEQLYVKNKLLSRYANTFLIRLMKFMKY